MDQAQRTELYKHLKQNELFKEFLDYIKLIGKIHENAADVDLTNLGNGAILAREKAFGTHRACQKILDYAENDLATETPTLQEHKATLAEQGKLKDQTTPPKP